MVAEAAAVTLHSLESNFACFQDRETSTNRKKKGISGVSFCSLFQLP